MRSFISATLATLLLSTITPSFAKRAIETISKQSRTADGLYRSIATTQRSTPTDAAKPQ